jgi:hypothetical protein
LQKSYDGNAFYTVSTISPTDEINYNFVDSINSQNSSIVYYRLKVIEKSSQIDYSDISRLRFETPKRSVVVYPNPIRNTIYFKGLGLSKVTIYDEFGKVISNKKTNVLNVKNSFAPNLKSGIYFLKLLLEDGEIQTEKVSLQP